MNFLGSVKFLFSVIRREKFMIYLPALFDLLFLSVFAIVASPYRKKIAEFFYYSGLVISQDKAVLGSINIQGNVFTFFLSIFFGPAVRGVMLKIGLLLILLAIISFFIYVLFQSLAWKYSLDFISKGKYLFYLKRFFLVSSVWFAFFCVIFFLYVVFSFVDATSNRNFPSFFSLLVFVLFLALAYFSSVSYVLIKKFSVIKSFKDSFRVGFRNIRGLSALFGSFILLWFLLNYLFVVINSVNWHVSFVFGALFIFPLLSGARIVLGRMLLKD